MPKSYNMGYQADETDEDSNIGRVSIILKDDDVGAAVVPINENGDDKKAKGLNGVTNGKVKMNGKSEDEVKDDDGKETEDGKTKPEEKPRAATFGELFSLATCFDRTLIFVAIFAAMATGSAWPVMFLIFGDMTNDFVGYGTNGTNSTNGSYIDPSEFEDRMTGYALKYIYIGLAVCVATYTQMALLQVACERQTYKLRTVFFKALLRQNIGWYDKHQSGELTTRLADDLERIREGTGDKIGLTFQMLAQFVSGFVIGFVKGWKMTLVIMSVSPLLVIFGAVIGKVMTSFSTMEQQKYAKAGAVAEEVLSCIRTVTSFNGQTQEIKKYGSALQESMRVGIKKSFITGLSVGTTMLVMFGAYGLGFWFGSTQVDDYYNSNGADGLAPGEVLTVFFGVMVGSFALGGASPHLTLVLTAKGAAGTIFSIIKDNPIINSSDDGGKRPESVQGYIQFKNVQFSYPSRSDVKVLKDFNLDIEPGQTVALVGASGCGKSTIVNLIQRFYDPDDGQILLDGIEVKDLNIHWLRQRIGVVSQEPILFGMSIAKNIELGKPGISEEEIVTAAKMANAHDFISTLPNGYDTLVGERGAQLSGGQKQRVAIARALVRDPRILLLDEATSALDSESEGIVQAALDKAREGRTTVVVAHRLSTIQNADVIYVLEGGELMEKGKHEELMAHKGVYYKLVTLQTITRHDGGDEGEEAEEEVIDESDNTELASLRRKKGLTQRQTSAVSTKGAESPKKTFTLFKSKKEEEETEEDKDLPRPSFAQMFKANMKELPAIIFGIFGATINGAIFPAFAVFFSEILKTFSKRGQELLDDGLLWSMLFIGLGGISFVANIIQNGAFGLSGEKLTKRLREQSFTNIVRQDMSYFDDPKHSTGALTTRLAVDASLVRTATGYRVAMVIQSITSVVAGLTIAFVYGWKLALAILAGVPLIMLSGRINMKLVKGNQVRDSSLMEAAGKTASECIENIRTVQSLAREPFFYKVYCDQLLKPYKENVKQAHIYGFSYAFSQSLLFFLYAAAFRFGAWLVVHDDMDPSLVFR